MISVVFVIGLLVSSAQSQVPGVGKCPHVAVQKNFVPQKYFGTWYEIAKFYTSFEVNQRCHSATYSPKEDGHFTVFNYGITTEDHEVNATGDAFFPDANEKAKIKVRFNNEAPYADYWVIDTDYTTYTLVWSCVDVADVSHFEFAWILARGSTLPDATIQQLYKKLDSFGIKSSHFIKANQNNCWSIESLYRDYLEAMYTL